MDCLLIADAGSTKTHWSIVSKESTLRFKTSGINPVLQDEDSILKIIKEVKNQVTDNHNLLKVFFFGAGCVDKNTNQKLKNIISSVLWGTKCDVRSDIIAVGKAIFGDKAGLVGILGTGSNTCRYKDGEITDQIPALGFILGDEGSGASLGKRLINNVFKRQLSEVLTNLFFQNFKLSYSNLIERVYRSSSPSAFLASFAPFIKENLHHPEIKDLVKEEFTLFFRKNVIPYKCKLSIGLSGSIAWYFKEEIKEAADSLEIEIVKIIENPSLELENYYHDKLILNDI